MDPWKTTRSKLYYSECFGKKSFYGISSKDAYMKACKWYASNVIAKDKLHNVQVEFIKDPKHPKVTLSLYAVLPEGEAREQHCRCCEEMHRAFFINENNNCNLCVAAGYQRRLEERIGIKVGYYKELLGKTTREKGDDADGQDQEDSEDI